jgi:hypothetical protein
VAPVLTTRLSRRQGVVIEDKGFSLAVHYRQAWERNSGYPFGCAIAQGRAGRWREAGRQLPRAGCPPKGLALERERSHFACDTVIYVGDDETDEDVFQIDRPGQLLSIRVGQKGTSAAPYYIRNQAEIDRLLEHWSACVEATVTDVTSESGLTPSDLPVGDAIDFLRLMWAVDHALQRRSKAMAVTLVSRGLSAWSFGSSVVCRVFTRGNWLTFCICTQFAHRSLEAT